MAQENYEIYANVFSYTLGTLLNKNYPEFQRQYSFNADMQYQNALILIGEESRKVYPQLLEVSPRIASMDDPIDFKQMNFITDGLTANSLALVMADLSEMSSKYSISRNSSIHQDKCILLYKSIFTAFKRAAGFSLPKTQLNMTVLKIILILLDIDDSRIIQEAYSNTELFLGYPWLSS